MRNLLLGLLMGLLIAAPIVHSQQQERIEVGVPLQIGLTKDYVISRIAERGFTTSKVEGQEEWLVMQKNDQNEFDVIGVVSFTNGRLSFASHRWAEATDFATARLTRNLYLLMKAFEEKGNSSCTIETKKQEAPDFDDDVISIHCGRRTALLSVSKYKEQKPTTTVDETIK